MSVWRSPSVRPLLLAQLLSLFGSGLTTVALGLLAYRLQPQQAPLLLGGLMALKMVAYVLLAPLLAGWAARLPRVPLMVLLDLTRLGICLLLPWVSHSGQLILLMLLLSVCSAAFTPLMQSLLPQLLPQQSQYQQALSISRTAAELEMMLSPLLATALLGIGSLSLLFVIDGFSYLASALLLVATGLWRWQPSGEPTSRGYLSSWRQYLSQPSLRGLLGCYLAVAAASAAVIVLTVDYVQQQLGLSEQHSTLTLVAAGVGAIAGAWYLPGWLRRVGEQWQPKLQRMMIGAALLLALTLLLLTAQPQWSLLLLSYLMIGAGLSLIQAPAGLLIRDAAGASEPLPLFAAQFSLSHLCWLLTYLLTGLLSTIGYAEAFAGLSALALIGALLAMRQFAEPKRASV